MRAIVLVVLALTCSLAHAQPTVRDRDLQLAPPDPELWRAQRRARFLLALGAGMAAASAVHVAWAAPNRTCGHDHVMKASLGAAGVFGGIGMGFAIGGGSWLLASSARHGYLRPSRGQRWAAAGLGAGAFLVTTVLTFAVWGFDSAGCST